MATFGYNRTSRDQDLGHPGSDPEVQRRELVDAGVEPGRTYADVAVSGAKVGSSCAQWHLLDQQLALGNILVVAAVDRFGRRYLETMWAIYDLQRRGIRLRSLASNEGEWPRFLDADPDSPEAFTGNILASVAAYVASQERRSISRRTKASFDADRARGKELGRPRRLTDERLTAILQDLVDEMPVAAIARKYGALDPHFMERSSGADESQSYGYGYPTRSAAKASDGAALSVGAGQNPLEKGTARNPFS